MRVSPTACRLAAFTLAVAFGLALSPDAAARPDGKKGDKKNDAPAKKKGDADGKNNKEGKARWEWKILDNKGKSAGTGTFHGFLDGTIKTGKPAKDLGTFKTVDDKLVVTITEGQLKGESTLVLVERKPLKYKGELVRADGSKANVVLEVIND